uniref:Uncharacterized protein n=1 Tax=Branchiostoma floridae TaxID=7739 RepID=C3ZAZ0_BRAFL|eukprot:XP_002594016.1 hypothetical protein BRAFLDRAFT_68544 [Branchiostoma floridae]
MEGIIKNQRDNHHQHHAEHVGVEAFVVVNSKSVTKTDSVADGFIARTGALYCYQLPHTSCIATAMVFVEYHLMQDRQMNKKDLSPAFLKALKKYEEFVWELEDDNPVGGWDARAIGCCVGTHKRCCRSTCATPMGHPAQRPHQRALETMTHKGQDDYYLNLLDTAYSPKPYNTRLTKPEPNSFLPMTLLHLLADVLDAINHQWGKAPRSRSGVKPLPSR